MYKLLVLLRRVVEIKMVGFEFIDCLSQAQPVGSVSFFVAFGKFCLKLSEGKFKGFVIAFVIVSAIVFCLWLFKFILWLLRRKHHIHMNINNIIASLCFIGTCSIILFFVVLVILFLNEWFYSPLYVINSPLNNSEGLLFVISCLTLVSTIVIAMIQLRRQSEEKRQRIIDDQFQIFKKDLKELFNAFDSITVFKLYNFNNKDLKRLFSKEIYEPIKELLGKDFEFLIEITPRSLLSLHNIKINKVYLKHFLNNQYYSKCECYTKNGIIYIPVLNINNSSVNPIAESIGEINIPLLLELRISNEENNFKSKSEIVLKINSANTQNESVSVNECYDLQFLDDRTIFTTK